MIENEIMQENCLIISDSDKSLLLMCINTYIEKIEFVLKNRKYYGFSSTDFLCSSFEEDLKKLRDLQIKLFSIDVSKD